jgi:hypothetical protein
MQENVGFFYLATEAAACPREKPAVLDAAVVAAATPSLGAPKPNPSPDVPRPRPPKEGALVLAVEAARLNPKEEAVVVAVPAGVGVAKLKGWEVAEVVVEREEGWTAATGGAVVAAELPKPKPPPADGATAAKN